LISNTIYNPISKEKLVYFFYFPDWIGFSFPFNANLASPGLSVSCTFQPGNSPLTFSTPTSAL